MKFSSGFHLFILFHFSLMCSFSGYSQEQLSNSKTYYNELYKSFQNEYGFDQELINGIFYEDQYRGSIGHQFMFENRFYKGTLVYKKKEYKDINLKYDIYEQQLIVFYTSNNSNVWVILSKEFISKFTINNTLFVKYNSQEEGARFYQPIFESERLQCLYFWYKLGEYSDSKGTVSSYKFTENKKKYYLVFDNSLKEYKNNKSFIDLFPPEIHNQIKEYLHVNKINVSQDNDDKVKELMVFCDKLL